MTRAEAIALAEYRRAHVPMYNDQKLKLGVFGINCSYGLNISHAPTTYKVTWGHTSEIVKRADAMGFELALPVARWRGFGGTTDFNGESFETYTWAAGLAQATRNIMVAADNLMRVLGIESQSFNDRIQKYRERLVAGWGTNPIIGTPEQVTDQLAQVSAAGVDGIVFGFLDYNEELKYFDSAVMPLLLQAGLRS